MIIAPVIPDPFNLTVYYSLRHDADILHLLFHRNKNQHGGTRWWQWFATLRRHVRKLLLELTEVYAAKSTPAKVAAVNKVEQRVTFLRQAVIPRAHDAFVTVVRDKQFVSFGCVLFGVLARVHCLIGGEKEKEKDKKTESTPPLEEINNKEIKVAKRKRGKSEESEMGVVLDRAAYNSAGIIRSAEEKKVEQSDKERRTLQTRQEKATESHTNLTETVKKSKKRSSEEGTKKKKKRKRGGDDLDALFSGIF